jgi:hypothetical protein
MGGEAQDVESVVALPGLDRGGDDPIVELLAQRDPMGIERLYERYGEAGALSPAAAWEAGLERATPILAG